MVKQKEEDTGIFKKVLVSSFCDVVKSRVYGFPNGKIIRVFTSVEPTTIQYEKI